MPTTESGWRAWNTPNEDADCLDLTVMGRDVITLSLWVFFFAQGHGERGTLSLEPGHCLQQVMDDELGQGNIFDEI